MLCNTHQNHMAGALTLHITSSNIWNQRSAEHKTAAVTLRYIRKYVGALQATHMGIQPLTATTHRLKVFQNV